MHPAVQKGQTAVITGAASGIGLAAAQHLARIGMRLVLADRDADRLAEIRDQIVTEGAAMDETLAVFCDVSDPAQIRALADRAEAEFGKVHLLMNNAGIQPGSDIFDEAGSWAQIQAINLGGIVTGSQIFGPRMIAHGEPGLILNTGSKQGITTPPGDPAYNVAKAGVKAFTEALQHDLRNRPDCRVEARLFIPGFVFTGLTAQGRTEKPTAAWTPEEVVQFLFEALEREDFYILCPDNDVNRAMDEKRILWAAGDIVENRPPLSRWHPDYEAAFAEWMAR
ncbi:SDR family NAD(P)-dependent oxidoreductase [Thioclava sp. BHET1]|nr:SDR family NAD(P)-dependent oxidoreductase [Thioclava sp. BHET1]